MHRVFLSAACASFLALTACNDAALQGYDPNAPPPDRPKTVDGTYLVTANPSEQQCGGGLTRFVATQVVITTEGDLIWADWGLDTQQGVTVKEEPAGTMTQGRFYMSWAFDELAGNGFTTSYENDWEGDLYDDRLISRLDQAILIQGGLAGACSLSWQVEGVKQ